MALNQAIQTVQGLADTDRAILALVIKTTVAPGRLARTDLDTLRALGRTEAEIFDLNQVIGLFAYMNRMADGTGVGIEPRHRPLAEELFGAEAVQEHLDWSATP